MKEKPFTIIANNYHNQLFHCFGVNSLAKSLPVLKILTHNLNGL